MSVTTATLPLFTDSLGASALLYSNEQDGIFRYTPATLTLSLSVPDLRQQYPAADAARLAPPLGWQSNDQPLRRLGAANEDLTWQISPAGLPASCRQTFRCDLLAGETIIATVEHTLAIELWGHSAFDPVRDIPPFRNSTADLGDIEPRRELFDRTYRGGGMILPGAFFRGLYRDIVFLASGTDARGGGGLCTGMARYALGCSLTGEHPPVERVREVVQIWHGRQMTDAALLAAAAQFLTPNAAGSFQRFREQVLTSGYGSVAFDIGIARWEWSPHTWPEIFQRLVTQGHTIVPYAFRQTDDDSATVQVYDPSYPAPEDAPQNIVRFDLARNRYAYRGFGALDRDDPTTVLAVTQRPFSQPGTAFLASLASLIMHPATGEAEVRGNKTVQRGLAALATGLLGIVFLRARRKQAAI